MQELRDYWPSENTGTRALEAPCRSPQETDGSSPSSWISVPCSAALLVVLISSASLSSTSFLPLLSRQDYISKMDPASTLGLSTESIHGYSISHVKRLLDAEPPELPPCRRGVNNIAVSLKGQYRILGARLWDGGTIRWSIVYSWSRNWLRGCRVEVTRRHKIGSPGLDSSQGTCCSQDVSAPLGLPLHPPP